MKKENIQKIIYDTLKEIGNVKHWRIKEGIKEQQELKKEIKDKQESERQHRNKVMENRKEMNKKRFFEWPNFYDSFKLPCGFCKRKLPVYFSYFPGNISIKPFIMSWIFCKRCQISTPYPENSNYKERVTTMGIPLLLDISELPENYLFKYFSDLMDKKKRAKIKTKQKKLKVGV